MKRSTALARRSTEAQWSRLEPRNPQAPSRRVSLPRFGGDPPVPVTTVAGDAREVLKRWTAEKFLKRHISPAYDREPNDIGPIAAICERQVRVAKRQLAVDWWQQTAAGQYRKFSGSKWSLGSRRSSLRKRLLIASPCHIRNDCQIEIKEAVR